MNGNDSELILVLDAIKYDNGTWIYMETRFYCLPHKLSVCLIIKTMTPRCSCHKKMRKEEKLKIWWRNDYHQNFLFTQRS